MEVPRPNPLPNVLVLLSINAVGLPKVPVPVRLKPGAAGLLKKLEVYPTDVVGTLSEMVALVVGVADVGPNAPNSVLVEGVV